MASQNYLPRAQGELLTFAENVVAKVTGGEEAGWGLTAAQITELTNRVSAFSSALAILGDPMTRSNGNVGLKDIAMASMTSYLREILQFIRNNPITTPAMLTELGLQPRAIPSTIQAPTAIPFIKVLRSYGSMLYLLLSELEGGAGRGKPENVAGATLMWASGPSAPQSPDGWQFLMSTTKVTATATFPTTLPAGTTIWLAAFWTNAKGQAGPTCIPVSANLPGGASQVVMGAESPMKIAA